MFKFIIIVFIIIFSSCSTGTESEYPEWVDQLISEFQSQPVANPPQSIWQYKYKGQIVYYIPPQCCDVFSILYDSDGNVMCAPDGGFTGAGDGHCTDFFSKRSNEKLVWKDTRSRIP